MTEGGAHLSQYGRVVLKLSGESFADATSGFGIDAAVVQRIADEVATARRELGVERTKAGLAAGCPLIRRPAPAGMYSTESRRTASHAAIRSGR